MKKKSIILCLTIIVLSSINIINTSALSYSSSVNVGFTFNPTLSVNISPSDLMIQNLTPGTAADSNNITVSVATNTTYGYTLSAIMNGNNSNLTHNNGTNVFSSIATDADLSDLEDSKDTNIWGYSYKDDTVASPAWSNYNGLSSSDSTALINTNSNVSSNLDFKIAAKASNTQASGTYNGVINFTAVSNIAPMSLLDSFIASGAEQLNGYFKMQDMTHDICSNVDIEESELQLIDVRDNKIYWAAKLKDGNCWMTQSLDIAGGTEITAQLSDIPANYTLSIANGFQEGNKLPESSQTGFNNNTQAYVFNTGNNTDNCASPGCYSYYSWHAATVGSGINITANNDAPYSICPKNWKLPNSQSDFDKLTRAYGSFYSQAGPNTTPNFLISRCYSNGAFCSGSYGNYWSSTPNSVNVARNFYFNSSNANPGGGADYRYGFNIRCIAR